MNLHWTAGGKRKDVNPVDAPILLNNLLGPRPVVLIGTYSKTNGSNLAIFNTFQPIGSQPPVFSVLIRPLDRERHTYENIKSQKEWSINFIRPEWAKFAHQTAKHIPKSESEFDEKVLVQELKSDIGVPFVKNAPIQMHMEWLREIPIPENGTRLVLGRLRQLWTAEDVQIENGLGLDAFPVLSSWGLRHYIHGNNITEG